MELRAEFKPYFIYENEELEVTYKGEFGPEIEDLLVSYSIKEIETLLMSEYRYIWKYENFRISPKEIGIKVIPSRYERSSLTITFFILIYFTSPTITIEYGNNLLNVAKEIAISLINSVRDIIQYEVAPKVIGRILRQNPELLEILKKNGGDIWISHKGDFRFRANKENQDKKTDDLNKEDGQDGL